MDGVGLGARSVQGLDTKSGLGLDMDLLTVKSRAKKMHGEEKSGFKKRPKMVDSIEARVDSDDDEPIGSLFKLKKPRNPTRVTDGSGGGGGKALKVEVKAEKLVPGDGDFGGMDDTLANFRKKLRGPKKDSGSITMTEQSSVLNELDLSVQFTDESIMERGHDMKSSSKNTVKGQSTRDNGLDVMKKDKGSECGSKRKFRRSKVVSVAKESGSCAKFNDFQDSLGPESTPSQNQREDANGLDRSLDENLEDSLAAFVQKAQFGSIRKTRTSSSLKQRRKAPISEGGLSPTTGSISEDLQLVAARGRRSASALKQARKKAKLESDLLIVSATLTTEPARHQRSPEDTKSVDGSHEASKRKQENATPVEPFKEPSLVLMDKYDAEASSDDRRDKSVGSILEDPVPNSQLSESHLGSVTCSKETIKLKDAISDRQAQGCEEVPAVEPCESDQYCDGDTSACVQVNESCSPPTQIVIMGSHDFKDGLKHCSVGKPNHMVHDDIETSNPRYNSKLMEETHGLVKVELCGGTSDMDQQSKRVSTTCHSSLVQKVCSASFENEIHVPGFDDNLSDRPSKNKSEGSHKQLPGKILGASSKFSPRNSSTCHVKLEDFSKSAFDLPKKEETCSDGDSLIQFPATQREKSDLASASLQENTLVSNCGLSSPDMMSGGADESELAAHKEPQEKCSEADDISNKLSERINPNELVASVPKCSSVFLRNQSSDGTSKGNNGPNHDYNSVNEETNDASSPSIAPDENEGYPEDAAYVPDPESKNNKLSVVQRAARKAKKHRHVDMAYEGDADWDSLIHVQGFLESHPAIGIDQASRMREKFDYSSNMVAEDENGGVAAVSAGLKARAVGPVEKIKFKEILKRKGGLQDYLECRNHILGLWSRDVSRILLLVDCGVTDIPANDEPPRASLTRDIYEFLDHRGYINAGIASKKKKAEFKTTHNYRLLEERNFDGNCGVLAADSEDGVSFILGQVKSTEAAEAKNDVVFYNEIQTSEPGKVKKLATLRMPELTSLTEPDKCLADTQEYGCINGIFPSKTGDLDVFISDPSCKITNGATVPLGSPEIKFDLHSAQYASKDYLGNDGMQCDSDVKKKIIVIGAGPAGLTAARHLQRRGFSVIVLEARNRIGGRVYTDRSSLSVPVDLGASIITGVEADAATERRPDPSSLICAQLGLELTVLNSDCPLYDIATGQKVPADLDEALEAEYNSLLDDMVLLVAQKGEHAMRMSLEDGLEYALKRRRIARSGTNYEGSGLHNSVNNFIDSEKVIVGSQTPESSKSKEEILSPLERRVMDWHFANLEYGCAALLQEVSLPYWNQDDIYGGFGGAHCMIKGGYSTVVESLGAGLHIHLNHMVTDVSYCTKGSGMIDNQSNKVKVFTSNGSEFSGDAVLITVPLGCLKAETIKFSPPLPQWKISSVERLGFGVLNKVVLEFPEVFWDNSVDYFGATAEETNRRGQCFMFWNVKKTVGAPVLIALVVGKAAIEGQNMSTADHVNHAVMVLRKLFGEASVPDPVASVVTDWGRDPFSYGAYSYVAVGASGEDYDILGQPVENCLFFAGEATCKEHPDTVGGAMMSGLREAVRIIDILSTGNDYTAEVEAMEAAQRHSDSERNEVRDIMKRLDAVELSNVLYKSSLDGDQIMTREALLQDMFCNAKTTAGRLHLAKELLSLPVEVLKSFAGTKKGLSILNSWILDSMGKDGTQLLRHCVRILVLVSTDLLAVRLSGIGKTVKEKVCVHTSRDIRAIASQLVSMWIEVFRKEKAANGGRKLLKQAAAVDSSKSKPVRDAASGKPPLHMHHGAPENKISHQVPVPGGNGSPSNANYKKVNGKPIKIETVAESKSMTNSSRSQGSAGRIDPEGEAERSFDLSEEEKAAFAAAEAARAAALAAAEAYASSEARCNTLLQLPKIPSFHKFARREQYAQMDESEVRRKWPGGVLGRQDCLSEIDSRNCRVRNWSVDFSAACVNLDSSRTSADNLSHGSHSNEIACQLNLREHSGESTAVDSSAFTKAWVDTAGCIGMKDYHAIERWQSQAMAVDPDLFDSTLHIRDEEDSTTVSKPSTWKHHHRITNESSVSHVSINKDSDDNHSRGAERIKQAVVDYVASLLMPLYKAKKIDKEGYKSIMKKTATKVMEQTTEVEKTMYVSEFLDFKRKNKIRAFVDKLIERHMTMKPDVKPDGPKV